MIGYGATLVYIYERVGQKQGIKKKVAISH